MTTKTLPVAGKPLTINQLAERWGVSTRTVYRLKDLGQLPPHFLVGRVIRFRLADVEAYETNSLQGGRR